jgi:ABC-2 type transport system permease protein
VKNLLAVAKREFRSAFDLPIAYVFIAAFLILAALAGLFGFFDRGVADLRDYFAGLRYAFVLFAPAVSMRLWAEERRSRTFELLFTLPVRPWEAVLGKFLGALGLVLVALALGGVLPLTLSAWGKFDGGAVFAGYLGVVLLAAAEIALGLFISALTDNQIVAFVGTAVAIFLLLVAGEPAFLTEAQRSSVPEGLVPVRDFLVRCLAFIGTGEHQEGLARGVLDTRDLVYFFGLTAFFLFGNVLAVEGRTWRLASLLPLGLALAAFFLAEDVATRRDARFDLTARRSFSLHTGTKAALAEADALLTIRCYLSRDLPVADERRRRALLDFLKEVEAQGGKNVKLDICDPKGDEKLAEQARREGLQAFQRLERTSESAESKVVWAGVSLLYAGKPPVALNHAIYNENLEYDFAVSLRKLIQKDATRVAWIDPVQPHNFSAVKGELSRSYTVEPLDLRVKPEISNKDYKVAVLNLDPSAVNALDERELYVLDQFLMKGGSLIVLIDAVRVDPRSMKTVPLDWGKVQKTLERWGVTATANLVLAASPGAHRWPIYSKSQQLTVLTDKFFFIVEPSSTSNEESPVARQIGRGYFPFPGEVALVSTRVGVTLTPLLRTARDSWIVPPTQEIDPFKMPVSDAREPKTIAGAVTGELQSAFLGPVPTGKPGNDPLLQQVKSTTTGRLIVFANTEFVRDETFNLLRQNAFNGAFESNATVFLNTVDWAAQDASLSNMRSRVAPTPLEASAHASTIAWGVNLLLMPFLVGCAGVLRFLLRRRRGSRAAALSRSAA